MRSISMVPSKPSTYILAPIAIPIPTVIHIPAAVVIPLTSPCFPIKISPPPSMPMPDIIPAATLDMSTLAPLMAITSKNPYLDTIIISAEAIATTKCVLTPADFILLCLSIPTAVPHSPAHIS